MISLCLLAATRAAVPASTLEALSGREVVLTDNSGAQLSGTLSGTTPDGAVLITPAGDVFTVPLSRIDAVRVTTGTAPATTHGATPVPPSSAPLAVTSHAYDDGVLDGQEAARTDAGRTILAPGALGVLAGAGCGLLGVPIVAVSYALAPTEPRNGPWTDEVAEYREGYTDGYREVARRRRIATSVGASLVVGGATTAILLAL